MKKILLVSLILFTSAAHANIGSSLIRIPENGTAAPTQDFSLPLDKLMKNVQYDIACSIKNPSTDSVDIRFDVNLPTGGGYGVFSLNGTELENNQGSLIPGNNKVTIPIAINDNGSTLMFKNLDLENSLEVGPCEATPIVKTVQAYGKNNSRFFTAYNDTDNHVQIEVGNFFPTPYEIKPHSYRIVTLSTETQNVKITKIFNERLQD